jgi:hypothetical membrane protein
MRTGYRTAGVAALGLMVVVTTADGLTRPGYSTTRHWISHLSLGDRGWLGVCNLVVCGLLLAAFGTGLLRKNRSGPASRSGTWGGALMVLAGAALVAAGMFRIDPGLDYPSGEPATRTTTGALHDLAAGVLFASLIAASILLGRAIGRTRQAVAAAAIVTVTFIACSVLAALDYAGTWPSAPSGLLERIALFVAIGWPVATAFRNTTAPTSVSAGPPRAA